jgi:peptidoglycan/xylan/chitin deacetylase (PgdA/CDA1 family)
MAGIRKPLLLRFYRHLQKRLPTVLFHGDAARREIALTFDDGPHPRDTPQVLDVLAKYNVCATFFLVGKSVKRYPHLARQIHQNGHQLALHCERHIPFVLERPSRLLKGLSDTRNLIADICGIPPEIVCDVRPPYGFFTSKTLSLLHQHKFRLVIWSSIPPHWMQPISWTVTQILDEVMPGSVIVLHDGHGHGSKVAQIVDTVIPRLRALEFVFTRVQDMRSGASNR